MNFLSEGLNGVMKFVGITPADAGAEPALSDPGPGTWYLRSIGAIRSWVASIPWAGVDKTGAVASDIGALDSAPILAGGQLSGFADKANITQSYNEANRTVTTSHPSGTIVMYWRGARITKASPWTTAAHSATVNQNYFYYSSDGVNFNWSTMPWEFEDIQVAMIRFGTSLKLPIRECHGLMDPASHKEFHDRLWTYVDSGGALTAGTYAIQVADNASITPGVDACVLQDEDLATPLSAMAEGSYSVCTPLAGEFKNFASSVPFPYGGTIVYYPTDNPAAPANNKFLNVYRVAVPTMDPASPVRWLWLAPQAQYDTLALASAESFNALRLGDLALGTSEYVPFERIVFKFSNSFTSIGKVWIEAIQPLERVAGVVSSVGASVLSGSGVAGEPTYWASPSSLASETAANFRTRIAALPVANPTATGTLTAPDVVVSNMAGTGLRTVAADSTGKLVQNGAPILVLTDSGIVLAGTWATLLANDADTRYRISANTAYVGMRIRLTSFGRHTISTSGSIVHEVFIGPYGTTVAPYYANATNDTVAKTAFASGTIDYQTVVEIIFTAIGGSGSALVRTETKFTQAGDFDPVISTTSEAITVDTTIDRWINFRGGNTSITSTYTALERFTLVP